MALLVEWLWQGLLIAGVTRAVVQVVPRRAAAVRYGLWWLAMILVLALPLLSIAAPLAAAAGASTPAAPAPADVAAALTLPAPPDWLLPALLGAWIACSLVAIVRLAIGFISLRSLVNDAAPFDPARVAHFVHLNTAVANRAVAIRVSRRIRGACAVGFSTPTLLVSNQLEALDNRQLEAILLHELAHLERRDDWSGLLQRVLLAVGGVHVAVWWISRHIDVEREAACDLRVIGRINAPVMYASSLAEAASLSGRGRGIAPVLAPGSSTTRSMLMRRVERVLHAPVPAVPRVWLSTAASVVAMATCVVVLLQAPALVAFAALPTTIIAKAEALVAQVSRDVASAVNVTPELPAAPTPAKPARRATAPVAPSTLLSVPVAAAPPAIPETPFAADSLPNQAIPQSPAVPLSPEPLREPDAALPSTPLTTALRTDADAAADKRSMASRFVNFGTAVADAGVSTGQTAARAGKAIGNFFKF